MSNKNIVHVVGTGTIGEPLIGLFTDFKEKWGIDEVTFHKRTPKADDKAMVEHLINHGGRLVVDEDARDEFTRLGHRVSFTTEEALERATVVVDCTPAGNDNKAKYYDRCNGPKGFLAQGSEFGFGKPYARGINEEVQSPDERFVQIVSCNTHNISVLLKTHRHRATARSTSPPAASSACAGRTTSPIRKASSPRPRRASMTIRNSARITPATRYHLFQTLGEKLNLFSSAIKINTQYMHTLWFDLDLKHDTTLEEVKSLLRCESARGLHEQALGEPDLLVRTRPRLLRPHPLADGDADLDADRAESAEDRRLLLHAAGRQLAALVDRRDAALPRRHEARRQPRRAAAVHLPGDLTNRETARSRPHVWAAAAIFAAALVQRLLRAAAVRTSTFPKTVQDHVAPALYPSRDVILLVAGAPREHRAARRDGHGDPAVRGA